MMKLPTSLIVMPKTDRKTSARATMIASQNSFLNFARQYQTRRRETMSSSTSSRPAPYMLARGIKRCASTSMKPRNMITKTKVPTSAQKSGQSCWT